MKPVDFDTQFALMVSMGLIEPEHVKVKMKPREIRRKDLTLVKVIGSGAFGEVYKAQLDEMFTRSTPEYTVAAKTVLDAKSSPEATNEMLAEAGVMAAVGSHPNLVSLIGVITRGDPLVLILQFCAQGELLGMVKKAAALANVELGLVPEDVGAAIISACDAIIDGALLDQFVADMIQGGAGTSTNMNANEVIANLALELLGDDAEADAAVVEGCATMLANMFDAEPALVAALEREERDGLGDVITR